MVAIVVIIYNCTPFLHSLLTKGKNWGSSIMGLGFRLQGLSLWVERLRAFGHLMVYCLSVSYVILYGLHYLKVCTPDPMNPTPHVAQTPEKTSVEPSCEREAQGVDVLCGEIMYVCPL